MPRRHKTPPKQGRPIEPAVRVFRARDSGTDGNLEIDSPRARRPYGIFTYPNCVVACFKRYPQYQHSILVSHFALGLLILSVLANCGSISRSCCGVYRAARYLIEIVSLCRVGGSQWSDLNNANAHQSALTIPLSITPTNTTSPLDQATTTSTSPLEHLSSISASSFEYLTNQLFHHSGVLAPFKIPTYFASNLELIALEYQKLPGWAIVGGLCFYWLPLFFLL